MKTFDFMPQPDPRSSAHISKLLAEDRPLYRAQTMGTDAMANRELLALIIGGNDGLIVADNLITTLQGDLAGLLSLTVARLQHITGFAPVRAARIAALASLHKRLASSSRPERKPLDCPAAAADILTPHLAHLTAEQFHVLVLNTRMHLIEHRHLYTGTINTSVIRIAEVFTPAIERRAAAIIVAHNHPSGDPAPSPEDVNITLQICEAGKLLDINLVDHLIIGRGEFVSMKERGLGFA